MVVTTSCPYEQVAKVLNVPMCKFRKLLLSTPRVACFGFAAPRSPLGSVSMVLHQVTVMYAAAIGGTRMLRTDCFGKTRLVLLVPSSS